MNADEALAWLKRKGSRRNIDGMARYGIVAKHVFGVSMGTLLPLKKKLGRDQQLSLALWKTGWYEARLLAALIGDPARVTRQGVREARRLRPHGESGPEHALLARRLAASEQAPPRWVGRDALKDLTKPRLVAAFTRCAKG